MSRIFTFGKRPLNSGRTDRSGRYHQVRRLDVAVNEPLLEGVLQALRSLANVVDGIRHRQRADLADQPQEVDTRYVLHRHIGERPIEVGLVNRDDIRVVEKAGRLDLGVEPVAGTRMFRAWPD